ncbi:MAG: CheB methylesterase domain-containing protein, partial [Myxococcota bacterium]
RREPGPRATTTSSSGPIPGARVVAIAASTGGPAAIARVLAPLPQRFDLPILLVQHMTEGFLEGFARHLDETVALRVKLAEDGERLAAGTVYVAPDGHHLGVRAARVALSAAPPLDGFRPSGSWLFRSVAEAYGPGAFGVILTGMGTDGVEGLRALRAAGGRALAQDESTCVVYGMPKAAVEAGVVEAALPIADLAARMCRLVGTSCGA